MCKKFRENLSTSFRENGVLKFSGGSKFRVHPLRGSPDPNCLLHFVTLGKAKNINLKWGESPPPIWERYWGLKISKVANFGPKLLELQKFPTCKKIVLNSTRLKL